MHDYVGSSVFQDDVTAKLERLSTACEVLLKTVPTFIEKAGHWIASIMTGF